MANTFSTTVASGWPRAILIGLFYFGATAVTVRHTRFEGGAAFVWISTAILFAELAVTPLRAWFRPILSCTAGGMAATALFGIGVLGAPLIAPFNIGEAVIAVLLLRRFTGGKIDLGTLPRAALFTIVAGIVAPVVTGIGGGGVIALVTGREFLPNFFSWLVGHGLGNITFAPLLLLLFSGQLWREAVRLSPGRRAEALVLLAGMIVVSVTVFRLSSPLLFLPMLPMIVASFRFGAYGAAVSVSILTVVGGIFTLQGQGPINLIEVSLGERVILFQFYLAVTVMMTLPVAAELQQRRSLFLALRESEARYRLFADGSNDVILDLAPDGTILYISPSIKRLIGYDASAIRGATARKLISPDDWERVAAVHARALARPGETFVVEYRAVAADGTLVWCETYTRGIADEEGRTTGVVTAVRDISRYKNVEAELERAANTDTLTGLVNRRVFDAVLQRRIEDVRGGRGQGCCAILDLDFFKSVNDEHGHAAGDHVLRAFASVAGRSLRENDLLARLGGEEFGLILWGAGLAEAEIVCERLLQNIADLTITTATGAQINFTVSGGIASIDACGSLSTILREADEALYRAKRTGRNRLAMAA